MAAFPTGPNIVAPIKTKVRQKTLTSRYGEQGVEQRRRVWLFPKRSFVIKYKNISKVDAKTLWQFYLDRSGSYEAFNFFMPNSYTNIYEGEYVGSGNGTATIFNLPSKTASSYTIYINGTEQSGSEYTFTSQGGTDGADKITFTAAPADGENITIDFTGILKVRCVFEDDIMDFETFYDCLNNFGIELRGLLNA